MIQVPTRPLAVCQALQSAGFDAWLVGGAVRDALLGRDVHDWDIATNARPGQIEALFVNAQRIGGHCGTVQVRLGDESFEVTPFRAEGTYSDGRHPDEVRFVDTIEEDLSRRDFTMNAVALDPIGEQLCDPFGGACDIREGRITAVGDASQRFDEDGLRLLRAARFAATLGFQIDPTTRHAMRANADRLGSVSAERVHDEWRKCMGAAKPSRAFDIMVDTHLLDVVVPEFMPSIGCEQNRWHQFDVWGHTMRVLDAVPASDPVLRFAGLFHDIAKPATKGVHPETGEATFYDHEAVGAEMTDGILQRLKFSNDDRARIVHHVRYHLIPYRDGLSAAALRRWVRRVGLANVPTLCQLGRADSIGKGTALGDEKRTMLVDFEERIASLQIRAPIVTSTTALAISGADVMTALGIGPGPRVGQVLRELLEIVTDEPELNTREALLKRVVTASDTSNPPAKEPAGQPGR